MSSQTRMLGAILTGAEQLRKKGLLSYADDDNTMKALWDLPYDPALGAEQLSHAKEEIHRLEQLCTKMHVAVNTSVKVLESRRELINTIKTTILRDSVLFSREDASMREEYKARFTSLLDDHSLLGMHKDGLELEYRDRIRELEIEAKRSSVNEEARQAAAKARETRADELKEAKKHVEQLLDQQRKEYSKLESQFSILKENYKSASERNRESTQKAYRLQSELESQRTQIDSLTQQLEDANEQLASAQVALNAAHTSQSAQDKFSSELAVTIHRLGEGMQKVIFQTPKASRTASTIGGGVGSPTNAAQEVPRPNTIRKGSMASSAAGVGRSPSSRRDGAAPSVVRDVPDSVAVMSEAGSVGGGGVGANRRTSGGRAGGIPPTATRGTKCQSSAASHAGPGSESQDVLTRATHYVEAAMRGSGRDPQTVRALRDALHRMRPSIDKLPAHNLHTDPPALQTPDQQDDDQQGNASYKAPAAINQDSKPSLTHVVHQFYCLLSFCIEAMMSAADDGAAAERDAKKETTAITSSASSLITLLQRAAYDIRSKASTTEFQEPTASLAAPTTTRSAAPAAATAAPPEDLMASVPYLLAALTSSTSSTLVSPQLFATTSTAPLLPSQPRSQNLLESVDIDTRLWRSRIATHKVLPVETDGGEVSPQPSSPTVLERPRSAVSLVGEGGGVAKGFPGSKRRSSVVTIQSVASVASGGGAAEQHQQQRPGSASSLRDAIVNVTSPTAESLIIHNDNNNIPPIDDNTTCADLDQSANSNPLSQPHHNIHPAMQEVHEAVGVLLDAYTDVFGNISKIHSRCATTLTKLQAKLFTLTQSEDRAKEYKGGVGSDASSKRGNKSRHDHPLAEALKGIATLEKYLASEGAGVAKVVEGSAATGSRGLAGTMLKLAADNPLKSDGVASSPPKMLQDANNQKDLMETLSTSLWGNSGALPDYLTPQNLNTIRSTREAVKEVLSKIKDTASEVILLAKHQIKEGEGGDSSSPPLPPLSTEQLTQLLMSFGTVATYCTKLISHAQLTASAAINVYQRSTNDAAAKSIKMSSSASFSFGAKEQAPPPPTPAFDVDLGAERKSSAPKVRTKHDSTQTPPVHVAPSEDAFGNSINAPWVAPPAHTASLTNNQQGDDLGSVERQSSASPASMSSTPQNGQPTLSNATTGDERGTTTILSASKINSKRSTPKNAAAPKSGGATSTCVTRAGGKGVTPIGGKAAGVGDKKSTSIGGGTTATSVKDSSLGASAAASRATSLKKDPIDTSPPTSKAVSDRDTQTDDQQVVMCSVCRAKVGDEDETYAALSTPNVLSKHLIAYTYVQTDEIEISDLAAAQHGIIPAGSAKDLVSLLPQPHVSPITADRGSRIYSATEDVNTNDGCTGVGGGGDSRPRTRGGPSSEGAPAKTSTTMYVSTTSVLAENQSHSPLTRLYSSSILSTSNNHHLSISDIPEHGPPRPTTGQQRRPTSADRKGSTPSNHHTQPSDGHVPAVESQRPQTAAGPQFGIASQRTPSHVENVLQHDFDPFIKAVPSQQYNTVVTSSTTTRGGATNPIPSNTDAAMPFAVDGMPSRPHSSMTTLNRAVPQVAIGKGGTTGTGRQLGDRVRPSTGLASRGTGGGPSTVYRVERRATSDGALGEVVASWAHHFAGDGSPDRPAADQLEQQDNIYTCSGMEPSERNTHSPTRSARAASSTTAASQGASNHISRRLQFLRRSPDRLRAILRDCESNNSRGKILPSVANPVSTDSFSLAGRTHPALS